MTSSPALHCCPECSAALPPGAPQALCPACLLRQALASRTAFDPAAPSTNALPPPSPAEIADKFPQFEITECLGRGGMGVVYRARQKSLDRWVALKILAPERIGQEKFASRFAREARILARLNHPNIVAVYDHGQTDGLFYIVMEFVDGVNLRDLLRDGKLEPKQALAFVPPICEALQYAHNKGVVHRDIKPENLLLDREGRVKVADFGVAALIGAASGERGGTPPYMAPEQADGSVAVDHRADIYALGVVLYELLTGRRPGPGRLSSASAEIAPELTALVNRAIEHEPTHRFSTATELGQTAAALATKPSRQRRGRRPVLFRTAAFVAFILSTALWLFLGGRELRPKIPAGDKRLWTSQQIVTDDRFLAKLPDGASIELLAVRVRPGDNRAWWRPDGRPSDFDPAIEPEGGEQKGAGIQALARLRPAPTPAPAGVAGNDKSLTPYSIFYRARAARLNDRSVPSTDYAILEFPYPENLEENQRPVLSMAVELGDWQTVITQKPGWLASRPFALRNRAWDFSSWAGGALRLTVHDLGLPTESDFEYRLIALDRAGREFPLRCSGYKPRTDRMDWEIYYQSPAIQGQPAIQLKDVAEVRWQARVRDHVIFSNVSLRAGDLNKVTITDFSQL